MSRLIPGAVLILMSLWAGILNAQGWPELAPVPSTGTPSPDVALIVGIEDYLLVPDIPGARQNAEDWFRYFRKTRRLPNSQVLLLRDKEATREEI